MKKLLQYAYSSLQSSMAHLGIRMLATKLLKGKQGPALSVIVVTSDNASYLNLTLASLSCQKLPADCWELIVIENGSFDNTTDILNFYQEGGCLPLIIKRMPNRQEVVEAINHALKLAVSPVVVFLGDNQVVPSDFLVNHLIHQVERPSVVIGDYSKGLHTHLFPPEVPLMSGTSPRPIFNDIDFFQNPELLVVDDEMLKKFDSAMFEWLVEHNLFWMLLDTTNCSVPRHELNTMLNFDRRFCNLDICNCDVAYRLYLSGLPFLIDPRVFSYSQISPKKNPNRVDTVRDIQHFFYKHPRLRVDGIESFLLKKAFLIP